MEGRGFALFQVELYMYVCMYVFLCAVQSLHYIY